MSLNDTELDRIRIVARDIKTYLDGTGLDEEIMRLVLRTLLQFRSGADLTGFRDQLVAFKNFLDTKSITGNELHKALILMQRVRF